MSRQSHTPYQCLGSYPTVVADAFEKTPLPADAGNFETVPLTGKEIILAYNTGATPRLVTIESIADAHKRTGDITETIAAGHFGVFGPFEMDGWRQSDGALYFRAAHAEIVFVVLKQP